MGCADAIRAPRACKSCNSSLVNAPLECRTTIPFHPRCAESWRDGGPALILDYSQTSLLYAPYRDEIRQIAPGLYLGLMFDRNTCPPKLKMYFALECLPNG